MKLPITLIVLTYNEEKNLPKCLETSHEWVDEIIIVDSHSKDRTEEIAKKYNAKFIEHDFVNQAQQFNWALDNISINNEWILRLDADEWITKELWKDITEAISYVGQDVWGFYMKRRVYFMGRWIKHGGYYPTWLLRLFRKGKGKSELRQMDEHIVLLGGGSQKLENDFVDENHNGLNFWVAKHNNYSTREANEVADSILDNRMGSSIRGEQAQKKRWMKEKIYLKFPIFLRALLYYFYRYVIRLGFLDGKEGFIFHFLQGLWYRFLVDAKIFEINKK